MPLWLWITCAIHSHLIDDSLTEVDRGYSQIRKTTSEQMDKAKGIMSNNHLDN